MHSLKDYLSIYMHNTVAFSYEILTVNAFGKYIWLVYKSGWLLWYEFCWINPWGMTFKKWPCAQSWQTIRKNVYMKHELLMFQITAIWTKCKFDWMIKATCNIALSQITAIFYTYISTSIMIYQYIFKPRFNWTSGFVQCYIMN